MKYLLILALLCGFGARAQNGLKFDKLLIDCEDKWIALSLGDGTKYAFGYVYLDNSAGLTFNLKGSFTIENNIYLPRLSPDIKNRIEPSEARVSLIPAKRLAELQVEELPADFKYIGKNNKKDRYLKLAETYKKWKMNKLAERYQDLAAGTYTYFSFDGTNFTSETISSPREASRIKVFNGNYTDSYQQEIFRLTKANKMREAQLTYIDAIRDCEDEFAKAGMAYNIAYQYYTKADVKNFDIWYNEVNRWIVKDNNYTAKLDKMKIMLGK
jgi:hypothetical protein